MNGRPAGAAWLLPLLTAAVGCGAGSKARPIASPEQVVFGVYRGHVIPPDGGRVPFRAWVWAEPPDRIHLEILPPLGGPEWIVDAGSGRIALTDVTAGRSFAGDEPPGILGRWLGVTADVRRLVSSLLVGGGDLPAVFELEGEGLGRLRMERTGYRLAARGTLGRGIPPPGVPVSPIDELDRRPFDPVDPGGDGP